MAVDATLSEKQKTILKAVEESTLRRVEELVNASGIEVDETYFDYTLLKAALKRKHKSLVNFLLKKNCRVRNENEINCDTALHYAIELEDLVIIRKLLKKGASIIDKNNDGKTPIILAAEKGMRKDVIFNHQVMRTLMSHYDFENVLPINEQSLAHFHIACDQGFGKAIINFVQRGFPVNSPADSSKLFNSNGDTPLHFAVKNFFWLSQDEYQLMTFLMDNGADYSLTNSEKKTPVHVAYYVLQPRGASEAIKIIFHHSPKDRYINSVDNIGLSHLHICCALNVPDVVEKFLENHEDVNCAVSLESNNNSGYTPLHFAVQNGHENIAHILLNNGADVSLKCKKGLTPLHLACQLGKEEITRLLLKFGAGLTAQDNKACIPLHYAFYKAPMDDLVSFLLMQTPKDVNYTDSEGLSIVHIACTRNSIQIVEHFLKQGVSPNLCTASDNNKYPGYALMHFAVKYNKKAMVQLLLKYGANPNINKNTRKITPLHTSCMHSHTKFYELCKQKHIEWTSHRENHIDIVKLLLQHKADANAKDSLGKTSLVYLCELSESPLMTNGAEWTRYNKVEVLSRKKILEEVEKRIIDIAQILLSCNADINACTTSGESILHVISKDMSISVDTSVKLVELFLKNKANVEIANQEKFTPLHMAVQNRRRHLVDIFLKHNADINAKTAKLMTPLQIAAVTLNTNYGFYFHQPPITTQMPNNPIVELLLENGCDVNNQNLDGETALHLAISKLNYPIVKQLLCYGADMNCEDGSGCPPALSIEKEIRKHYNPNSSIRNILKLLCDHIEKLEMIGIRTNIKSKKHLFQMQEKYSPDNDDMRYYEEADDYDNDDAYQTSNSRESDTSLSCESELEKMKNTKVDQYTSLYNILFKDDVEMSRLVKNNYLKTILADDELEKKFPLYGNMLKLQVRRGTEKIAILDNAKESLGYVTGFLLPDSCSERIFRYLTNNDLSTLIKVESGVSRKRKMNSHPEKTDSSEAKQMRLEE